MKSIDMKNVEERENKIELSKVFMVNVWKEGNRKIRRKKSFAWKWKWNDGNPGGLQFKTNSEDNECVNEREMSCNEGCLYLERIDCW